MISLHSIPADLGGLDNRRGGYREVGLTDNAPWRKDIHEICNRGVNGLPKYGADRTQTGLGWDVGAAVDDNTGAPQVSKFRIDQHLSNDPLYHLYKGGYMTFDISGMLTSLEPVGRDGEILKQGILNSRAEVLLMIMICIPKLNM